MNLETKPGLSHLSAEASAKAEASESLSETGLSQVLPIQAVNEQERRGARRAQTFRWALLSPLDAEGVPAQGTVVDVSTGGLRIHTRSPESVGQYVEVELRTKEGDDEGEAILVRGRVVYVDRLEEGAWAVGVRLAIELPRPGAGAGPRIHGAAEAREVAGVLMHQIRELALGRPSPLAFLESIERGDDYPESPRSRTPNNAQGTRRSYVVTLLLAAAMLLAGLLLLGWGDAGLSAIRYAFGRSSSGMRADNAPARVPDEPDRFEMLIPSPEDVHLKVLAKANMPEQLLGRAQEALAAGDSGAAADLFRAVSLSEEGSTLERFMGALGQAEALAGMGEAERARMLLARTLEEPGAVPGPWLLLAQRLRGDLGQSGPARTTMPAMSALLEFDLAPSGVLEEQASLRIEVVKSRYLLTVFRGTELLGPFPVGLGRDATTPEGAFVIANKLENPDWYNAGREVKSGDPDNPLGAWWMGLGGPQGPTPYGIHPTEEAGSIGGNLSRGCIRMRPEDAAIVFEACSVGTPVLIRP